MNTTLQSLPGAICINCGKGDIVILRSEHEWADENPQVWVATVHHVECANCGHKFQAAVIPEA